MIVTGKISGIHRFLFATNEAGGGQAKRLRARSFIISLVAEIAALRVLRALDWPMDEAHYVLHGAGKFLLSGEALHDAQETVAREHRSISEWLARHTNGELEFALASGNSPVNPVVAYREAQQRLHMAKARPWAPYSNDLWEPSRLVLEPLDIPCALCRRVRATEDEHDADTGEIRRICRWCGITRRLGQQLPLARWLVVRDTGTDSQLDLLDYGVNIEHDHPDSVGNGIIAVAHLQKPEQRPDWCPPNYFLKRRLMAHVPVSVDGSPLEFLQIAQGALGDKLLGVFMADVDSLGVAFDTALEGQHDLSSLTNLSRALDIFFAGDLKSKLEKRDCKWQKVYTIFSGGDDLVMVGPWDVMFDLAGQIRDWFDNQFGSQGLTLSAGLTMIKSKHPIKLAIPEAERLLESAKREAGPGEAVSRDQCAAFGQLWKWKHHRTILETALKLIHWVETKQMERGWLHSLLSLIEARHPDVLLGASASRPQDPLATARFTHHVTRNYRRGTAARKWADDLIPQFDETTNPVIRYLPVALRYALTATRTTNEKE